jgi:YHS domain-containing protein
MRRLRWGIAAGLALVTLAANAAPSKKPAPKPKTGKKAVALCPIGRIPAMTGKKDVKSVYKGKTYYFCCPECKPSFDKEPEKYLKRASKTAPKKK